MENIRYLILGAGPAGLAFAHTLRDRGEESFLLLEQEAVAGGLCRSEEVDGAPLDKGGGHFLDMKRPEVLELLFRFLPRDEWQQHQRISRINLRGTAIDYPLEANLWQLPVADQVEFLESIAQAGCVRGMPTPESFSEWISWKLGQRIAEEYMLPYNRKIWSTELDELGTYWLHKLPDVSFRETLQSCLEHCPCGSIPAHGYFLYPKEHGYGEVWRRMGESLGERLVLNTPVDSIDINNRIVNGRFRAETIITTIPWTVWLDRSSLPKPIAAQVAKLRYSSVDVDYCSDNLPDDAHWIYEPDENLAYHRILCRHNFCSGSRGYWTETNTLRSTEQIGWRYHNEFAYPLNTLEKPTAIAEILAWGCDNGIRGLGRWGTWEHMNSDVAVAEGIALAGKMVTQQ